MRKVPRAVDKGEEQHVAAVAYGIGPTAHTHGHRVFPVAHVRRGPYLARATAVCPEGAACRIGPVVRHHSRKLKGPGDGRRPLTSPEIKDPRLVADPGFGPLGAVVALDPSKGSVGRDPSGVEKVQRLTAVAIGRTASVGRKDTSEPVVRRPGSIDHRPWRGAAASAASAASPASASPASAAGVGQARNDPIGDSPRSYSGVLGGHVVPGVNAFGVEGMGEAPCASKIADQVILGAGNATSKAHGAWESRLGCRTLEQCPVLLPRRPGSQ